MKKTYMTPYADYARTAMTNELLDDGGVGLGGGDKISGADTTARPEDWEGKNRFDLDGGGGSLNGGNGVTWDF